MCYGAFPEIWGLFQAGLSQLIGRFDTKRLLGLPSGALDTCLNNNSGPHAVVLLWINGTGNCGSLWGKFFQAPE